MPLISKVREKIITTDNLALKVSQWKKNKMKVAFTNGCFDILHLGHLEILTKSKEFGDRLIVAVNSDESVRKLKGKERPINDFQTTDLPIKIKPQCKLLIFVDHHKATGTIKGEFVDIRESSGSTAAIYSDYLRLSPHVFNGEEEQQSKIATALMHGIRTDTDNYVNATELDYKAGQFLSKLVDRDLLSLISKQAISAKTMDLTQVALQHKDIKETYLFSGVGYVREEDRDGIGQCADYLLHREGIETVFVYGVINNSFIDGSLRTRSHTLDPDKWIKNVFGKNQDGKWYGGGRKDKGGFQIPLGVFSKCSDKELLWILIKYTIDELLYEKIGVDKKSTRENDIGKV